MVSYRIYILGYKRADSLSRLLKSLKRAFTVSGVPANLTISLDGGSADEVKSRSDHFEWTAGDKEVILHDRSLGLNSHINKVTEAASVQKEEFALFFEDDTIVHKDIGNYLKACSEFLSNNPGYFGASFYSYPRQEQYGVPFYPLRTRSLFYAFQRVPSRGWMAAKEQLRRYIGSSVEESEGLPTYMDRWESGSWERKMNSFLLSEGLQMLYPYESATTGYGEEGVHYKGEVHRFLSQAVFPHDLPTVSTIDPAALVKYDMYYEIAPEFLRENSPSGLPEDFTVDLYGTKPEAQISTEWILTTNWRIKAECGQSFGLDLRPLEQNVLLSNPGNEIRLVKKEGLRKQSNATHADLKYLFKLHTQSYTTMVDTLRMKIRRMFTKRG